MARTQICSVTRKNLEKMYDLELRTREMWNLVLLQIRVKLLSISAESHIDLYDQYNLLYSKLEYLKHKIDGLSFV